MLFVGLEWEWIFAICCAVHGRESLGLAKAPNRKWPFSCLFSLFSPSKRCTVVVVVSFLFFFFFSLSSRIFSPFFSLLCAPELTGKWPEKQVDKRHQNSLYSLSHHQRVTGYKVGRKGLCYVTMIFVKWLLWTWHSDPVCLLCVKSFSVPLQFLSPLSPEKNWPNFFQKKPANFKTPLKKLMQKPYI